MPLTEFGKVIREYRTKMNISLRQMVKELQVSATYGSAVEVGAKPITDDYRNHVIGFFRKKHLTNKELAHLAASIDRTRRVVDVSPLDATGRHAVAHFARTWSDLNKAKREKLLKQLGVQEDDEE